MSLNIEVTWVNISWGWSLQVWKWNRSVGVEEERIELIWLIRIPLLFLVTPALACLWLAAFLDQVGWVLACKVKLVWMGGKIIIVSQSDTQ